jgi:ligand-binding SRPBCC domain-containing protein
VQSTKGTNERAVAGRLSGLIELDEEVTWRARHFGVTQHLTSRITAFDRPRHFRDEMRRGAFKSFVHDHYFIADAASTIMVDVVVFSAPLGILGRVAERLILRDYLRGFIERRAMVIKESVEGKER